MKSKITPTFRRLYARLPEDIRQLARKNYKLFIKNPRHPSLYFKLLKGQVYSVRIGLNYRALGILNGDEINWFWIGPHREYEKIIASL